MIKKTIITFIAVLFQNILWAQKHDSLEPQDIYKMSLDEILNIKINVSSTLPLDVFETPSTVSVIDREAIEQYNFLSIAEAIQTIAGMEILQTVVDRNVPTIRGILQNFYANKVLIMIDNIPTWQPTYGNGTLDRLSINDVERIEILRGPASVLYGTNAYNGVINIIRRNPESSKIYAKVEGGYPDLGSASINITNRKGDLKWNISGSSLYESREPYLLRLGADTLKINETIYHEGDTISHQTLLYENDTLFYFDEEYRKYAFNFGLSYKSHSFYLNNFVNSYTYPGASATYQSGGNRSYKDKGTLLSYTFNKELNQKTYFLVNTHFEYFWRDYVISQAVSQSTHFSSYRLSGSAKLNYMFSDNFQVETGADILDGHNIGHYITENLLNTNVRENIKTGNDIVESSLFAQANYRYKWISILAGTRYTYNKNFGNNLSSRFTAVFTINNNNSLKLIYGQSYRTANLLELYFDHSSVVGNQELEPEKCTTHEFIYLTRIHHFFAQVTGYYSQYSNLIQRIRTSTDLSIPATYRNLSEFNGYGAELELKYQNPGILNCFFNYNLMKGEGEKAESNFKYVPKHTVSIGANKPIDKFFISSNVYMYSETNGPWEKIPCQYKMDVHLGYKQSWNKDVRLTHTLSIKNITNSDMLIPEYIRKRPGVNYLPTTAFGTRIIYSAKIVF